MVIFIRIARAKDQNTTKVEATPAIDMQRVRTPRRNSKVLTTPFGLSFTDDELKSDECIAESQSAGGDTREEHSEGEV